MGHSPRWPKYREREIPQHTLALLQRDMIVLEGGEFERLASWGELTSLMFDRNLLTFTHDWTADAGFPWVYEALTDPNATILCTETGGIRQIEVKQGRKRRRICLLWEGLRHDNRPLNTLREIYSYHAVGDRPSPGSMGQALQRASWWYHHGNAHMHTRPPLACTVDLKIYGVGARNELYSPGNYQNIHQLDQRGAFSAQCYSVPAGTACHALSGSTKKETGMVSFREMVVTIHTELERGIFPCRAESAQGRQPRIYWPTEPGTYHTWLWGEQVADAEAVGCTVKLGRGWYWHRLTNDLAEWAELMDMLRLNAPDSIGGGWSKLFTVAAIGWHGIQADSYTLHSYDDALHTDAPLCMTNGDMWYLRKHINPDHNHQTPWDSYIRMQAMRAVAAKADEHNNLGVLAIRTDAVVLEHAPTGYAVAGTREAHHLKMGEWKLEQHTNVTLGPGPRFVSDQARREPGRKRT